MGIVRVAKNSNYVVMNRTALNDKRLSWGAKGIMAYLLSMPDDWVFYMDELMTHAADGKTSFNGRFKELKDYGYVVRQPVKDPVTQKITHWETIVHEIPVEKPQVEKPHTGKPVSGKATDWNPIDRESHEMENEPLLSTDINQVLNQPSTDKDKRLTDNSQSSVNPSQIDSNFLQIKELYQQLIGNMNFRDDQKLNEALDHYEPALILEAVKKGAERSAKSFQYILGILDNWRRELHINSYADWQQKLQKGGNGNGGNQQSAGAYHGRTDEEIELLKRLSTYSSAPRAD